MESIHHINAAHYRDLLGKDLLLPQSGESPEARVLRIQEEHKFLTENNGRKQCLCEICGSSNPSSIEKGGA
ncbi:MAG: hypothetical protein A3H64_00660 [Candidatus Ryanbacteria bacterium RIFCSPLOWO2_02_FULL_45_11c]|uniref:Uncharacterized protein n=1 Tax=Candidatus Ryanbacteria bacterium RIFCSPLOWO2_02_FULL_45_11c TaxID=1802128 RepID=A0A1G2H2Y8_9BACT|nr:MAG: hypothetical protein A3H64_00660 [Candidatus Ryanbacteria bacterium RIFCSPLOWO2_02_FULL_45_11c]